LDAAGRNLSYYAYDDERCPRCNKRIWIQDLWGRKKIAAVVFGCPTGNLLLKGGVA
jgi:hypothetical protein